MTKLNAVGIDAMSFYVPNYYVDMERLAARRNIVFAKLNKGLGLEEMAVPLSDEDAASFAANALMKLISDNRIDPRSVGRIYLGTESALDASKPTITYAIELVEKELSRQYGERCFSNCDVVDMTFACVGAVDALHNSLDWVRNGKSRKAIVIASDNARYDLGSTGEYTQGAGAVAILVSQEPSLLSISETWGVAMKSEGDFFKPRRYFDKKEVFKEAARMLGQELDDENAALLLENCQSEFWNSSESRFELYKEEPVYDGPYSNECYKDRIGEALEHFKGQKQLDLLSDWQHLIFHLPYAFQARRMFVANWLQCLEERNALHELYKEIGTPEPDSYADWLRKAGKSILYQEFVLERIAAGEKASARIGNMYTASIFMSLLSLLNEAYDTSKEITGQKIGFFSYGSGSKSKVFEGTVQEQWKEAISGSRLFSCLDKRKEIDLDVYEQLHRKERVSLQPGSGVAQMYKLSEKPESRGFRLYRFS